ncbi:DUF433 domain-containing protein [Mesorhizobium carmichaelinearum]|uniref:DUF433 domain-containing protein n=1 Tax=Mesorhizobium carmichaelinearum TaxID=1208188 RepID=UPI000BA31B62|nr:DUF433 domain-containing protein [Mesorhizobium carmichaelinearum]
MNYLCTKHEDRNGSLVSRNLLSLKEVVTLADVSERRVRKDIETGVLAAPRFVRLGDSRLAFTWSYVVVLAAVYGNESLTGKLRKRALCKLDQLRPVNWTVAPSSDGENARWICAYDKRASVDIDLYLNIDLSRVVHRVSPRLEVYCTGLSRVEEKEDVLGGEAVFTGSRLSVLHIGKMVDGGERVENILEDYPYLNEDDIKFASLYYRAHPPTGRPRASSEPAHDENLVG